jgi:pSer/pThr/pTyr-binding forkhead associated (FHA) protein
MIMDFGKPGTKAPAPPRLINITEGSGKEIIPLGKSMLLVGREGANLNFEDMSISRNHASIINKEGKFFLRDNGSLSGSFVNAQRVNMQELKNKDVIRFGSYTFLVDLGNENGVLPDRSDYTLITIPASHKGERYKLSYQLSTPQNPGQGAITVMTTGYAQESMKMPPTKTCPACSEEVKPSFIFCPGCGARLIA